MSHRNPSPELIADVVRAIRTIKKDKGCAWPPTMTEVGAEAGRHPSAVFWVYRALAAKGYVKVSRSARSLVILKRLPSQKNIAFGRY